MIRSRLGLKALILSGLVLGLMAFATSAAQAETGATWSLKTKAGTLVNIPGANDLLPEIDLAIENSTASLLFTTGSGTKVEILCTTAKGIGVKLIANGSLSKGKVKFTGCLTKLNGALAGACTPVNEGTKGEILTQDGLGLLMLHTLTSGVKDPYVKLSPETNLTFVVISLGEECSIGESVDVKGHLDLKDCLNDLTTELVNHLVEEFKPLQLLTALGQPATIDGSANVFLKGEHEGLAWAGLPF